jgi:hypothetical protein
MRRFEFLSAITIFALPFATTVTSFAVHPMTRQHAIGYSSAEPSRQTRYMLPDAASSLLTAVEVFDGSTIVDPVVVSNVFWIGLKSKLLAFVIGQVLATIAFALLASFMATQITQLGEFATKKLFPTSSSSVSSSTPLADSRDSFIRADDWRAITPDFGKLLVCLAVDIIGSSSELLPIVGEVTDVFYAPIAATILRSLYGGNNVVFALEFVEEILPFTDILPLATIW